MKLKKVIAIGLVAAMAVSLVACGGTKITEMSIEPEVTIKKGTDYQMEVTYSASKEVDEAKLAEATAKFELEWTSSDESIAFVDQNGLVTAIDVGEADITVSVKDKELSATCKVTVNNPVNGINVTKKMELTVGDEGKKIDATVNPKDAAGYEIQYASSDEKVATVDKNGKVTPVAKGECVINTTAVATTVDGKAEDKAIESEATSVAEDKTTESKNSVLAAGETKVVVKDKESDAELITAEKANDKNAKTSGSNASASAKSNGTAASASNKSNTAMSSNSSNSSNAGSTSGSSNNSKPAASNPTPAPVQPTPVPAAPTPAPAPVETPAPAPADPVPDPAPAPDPEPDYPTGDRFNNASDRDNTIIEGGGISEGNGGDSELAPD